MKPRPKVAAAGIAGAFTALLVWVLATFGVEMPAEAASAVTTLVAFAAGWFKAEQA